MTETPAVEEQVLGKRRCTQKKYIDLMTFTPWKEDAGGVGVSA